MMDRKTKALRTFVLIVSLGFLSGCATLPNGRGWGQDATISPGSKRIRRAAVKAARAPEMWIPLAVALVLQAGNMDKRIADWAAEKTPVFGSVDRADEAGTGLLMATKYTYLVASLLTPSGNQPHEWAIQKGKGIAVGLSAIPLTNGATWTIKQTDRTRPDGITGHSFPSGHTSKAATYATLACRSIDHIQINRAARISLKFGVTALATATAWSRLEGNRHYPSDLLAGAAIGRFFGVFMNDAFLGLDESDEAHLIIERSRDGVIVGLSRRF